MLFDTLVQMILHGREDEILEKYPWLTSGDMAELRIAALTALTEDEYETE